MTATIRHVVLDVGRVLIEWDPERPYRRLIPDATERRRFLSEVCSPAWNAEQDRGRDWAEGEALLIARHPDDEAMVRAFRRHWAEMVPGPVEGSVAVLDELVAAGRDVTLLTNFAADTFEEARGRFPFLDRARGATVSGRVGLIKPDAAIYERHARDHALDPAATLFFDDTAVNVDAARRAGWHAEPFTTAGAMRADLVRHGVLPGRDGG